MFLAMYDTATAVDPAMNLLNWIVSILLITLALAILTSPIWMTILVVKFVSRVFRGPRSNRN